MDKSQDSLNNVENNINKEKQSSNPSHDYIEIKLPKILTKRFYLPIFLLFFICLIFYGLGLATMQIIVSQQEEKLPPTSAKIAFIRYAKKLGLNTRDFTACLDSSKYEKSIDADIREGEKLGITATPTIFINGKIIVGAQPYSVFAELINQELEGIPSQALTPTPNTVQNVTTGTLPILGNKNAPVIIIEFSDLQCPFCKRFMNDTFPEIKKDYIDKGKAKFAFRHFPLSSIHPNARLAHEAALCANEQSKFWEYHNLIFERQTEWNNLPLNDINKI